jgi:nucleotide-binding universal stress UspA family protein
MKSGPFLITGVDFSPCSLNALTYAADLCAALNASLVVLHAFRQTSKAGILTSLDRHVRQNLREELSKALVPVKAKHPNLHIEEVVKRGDTMDVILAAFKKYHAELVVLGAQGTHESPDIFIGSTTGAMIKLGDAPVLAIPSGCTFVPFKRVLFAVKHPYVASKKVLLPFLMLTEHFHSTVDLLHVTRDSTPDLSRYPDPYPIPPHTQALHTSDSDNIYHSVQGYLKEHSADLLVVISRLRGFFEGLFAQSSTSTTMFNSELPILALHGGVRD